MYFLIEVVDNWFDCGKKEVLLDINFVFFDCLGYVFINLLLFDNFIIIYLVSIGKNCKILNFIIGLYVIIGNNVCISYIIIKDSIIGNYVYIKEVIL